jgi:glycosyltransferase involved in cell wall biosynthesis
MPKILFISPLPPPRGGIASWTEKIFQYGLSPQYSLHLVNTKIKGHRNIFDKTFLSVTEIMRNLNIIIVLIHQLIFARPQLIHLNSSLSSFGIWRDLLCVLLAKIIKLPVVTHYHGHLPDFKKRLFGLNYAALKLLMHLTNINVVTNQVSYQYVQQFIKANCVVLPNFIEDNVFLKIPMPQFANDSLRAIFAGGITKAKGCLEILNIAKRCPEIEFHLFGKMHADVADEFNNKPNNMFIHEVVNQETLWKEMQASDFLLFPSYTEGFPLTVLEAMSVGLPIIATRVGAIPEMIDEGKGGFLVSPYHVDELCLAINKLSADRDLKITMGQYNRDKSFNTYRYAIVMEQLQQLYQEVLDIPCAA